MSKSGTKPKSQSNAAPEQAELLPTTSNIIHPAKRTASGKFIVWQVEGDLNKAIEKLKSLGVRRIIKGNVRYGNTLLAPPQGNDALWNKLIATERQEREAKRQAGLHNVIDALTQSLEC